MTQKQQVKSAGVRSHLANKSKNRTIQILSMALLPRGLELPVKVQ